MRLGSVCLLLLAATPLLADDHPTPKYEGKPLDYWVAKLESPADEKECEQVMELLKRIGPDAKAAVPALKKMLPSAADLKAEVDAEAVKAKKLEEWREAFDKWLEQREKQPGTEGPQPKKPRSDVFDVAESLAYQKSVRGLHAAIAVAFIDQSKEAVEPLLHHLTAHNGVYDEEVARALERMGEVATAALPALKAKLAERKGKYDEQVFCDAIKAVEGKKK